MQENSPQPYEVVSSDYNQDIQVISSGLQKKQTDRKILFIILLSLLLLATTGVASYYYGQYSSLKNSSNSIATPSVQPTKVCDSDAKTCPDGSTVGRVGESCEFEACHEATSQIPDDWKTLNIPDLRISFAHPPDWMPITFPNNTAMVRFETPTESNITDLYAAFVTCIENTTKETVPCDQSFEQTLIMARTGFSSVQEKDVLVDAISAKHLSGLSSDGGYSVNQIYVPVGEHYFVFSMVGGVTSENLYQDVVKTMKFIK